MIAFCELCRKNNKEFKVPWDQAGKAMMREHLREKHNSFYNASNNRDKIEISND